MAQRGVIVLAENVNSVEAVQYGGTVMTDFHPQTVAENQSFYYLYMRPLFRGPIDMWDVIADDFSNVNKPGKTLPLQQ